MIKKIYYLALFAVLLVPNIANASCSYEENVRLQKLANNINFNYSFVEESYPDSIYKGINFTIIISNLFSDLYIYDNTSATTYYNTGGEIVIPEVINGMTHEFKIYSNIDSCKNTFIMTNYVVIPAYNRFYVSSLCKNIENYALCQKWYKHTLTEDEFASKIKKYKDDLNNQNNEEEPIVIEESLFEQVLYFLAKYNLQIFGSIIIISLSLIIYLKGKDDFDLK